MGQERASRQRSLNHRKPVRPHLSFGVSEGQVQRRENEGLRDRMIIVIAKRFEVDRGEIGREGQGCSEQRRARRSPADQENQHHVHANEREENQPVAQYAAGRHLDPRIGEQREQRLLIEGQVRIDPVPLRHFARVEDPGAVAGAKHEQQAGKAERQA